ncbi:Mirror-image polydactyly gene 1 protein [Acropora cervicornis]|uniref:Mirror-image polydactyly gene 1 protein n=1 Tax=Acropora cervicornis TaxID=6130 RepID=A0AAD9QFW7_ACRCE|nr:Mirror-image polydactyly gene 1 protein [Acropora cervicornis]
MDSMQDSFEYLDNGEDFSFKRGHSGLVNGYAEPKPDFEDANEIRHNLRAAMKGARQRIANLRFDLEEKDKLLGSEKSLRQKLEAELAEKTEQLYKERVRLGENGRYSPSTDMMLANLGSDSSFREELSVAQRLNLQVTNNNCLYTSILEISAIDAALVEKIYQAQKERDAAVNARLQLAHNEREELLDKLRRTEREHTGFDSGVDSVYDEEESEQQTMKSLLGRLTNSETPDLIDKHGQLMADRIRTVQRNRKRMVTEELKAVIAERDAAVEKAKSLEAEVINLRKEVEIMKNQQKSVDKQRLKAIQTQSTQALQEKDLALKKCKRLEEEMETIRVYYSLHRSLSQEESLRDQFNQTMNNFESRLRARDVDIQQAQRSYDDVVEKLKAVSQERNKLAKQLEESSKNRRKEKERADKLERLVGVLRKRISDSGGASVATIN